MQGKSDLYGPFWVCATLVFVVAVASNLATPVVINRLSGCQGFNQSIDEEIARQNRIGHGHNAVRLASLKRDCTEDDQEHYRTAPR